MTKGESRFRCGKCGAGAANIERFREHQRDGRVLLVACCRLCGWRLEADERLRRQRVEERPIQPKTRTFKPCPIVGCNNHYVEELSRSGLCFACGSLMRNWETGRRRTYPFIHVNGFRFKRRETLIPGLIF